ncbi:MAG: YCF48-related protein, partial [Calditrichota bacterium]
MPGIAARMLFIIFFSTLSFSQTIDWQWQDPIPSKLSRNGTFFLNSQQGWIVGNEGEIWHTYDGGTNWERRPLPSEANLWTVEFLDAQTGFVAGHTNKMFKTLNGGLIW